MTIFGMIRSFNRILAHLLIDNSSNSKHKHVKLALPSISIFQDFSVQRDFQTSTLRQNKHEPFNVHLLFSVRHQNKEC